MKNSAIQINQFEISEWLLSNYPGGDYKARSDIEDFIKDIGGFDLIKNDLDIYGTIKKYKSKRNECPGQVGYAVKNFGGVIHFGSWNGN